MDRRIPLRSREDIPERYRNTPIGDLIRYHNLGEESEKYTQAELLIGMCMDSRKHLRIPENFAFILRTGGGNLRYSEFKVSYAIAIGGVRAIALLAARTIWRRSVPNCAARRYSEPAASAFGDGANIRA